MKMVTKVILIILVIVLLAGIIVFIVFNKKEDIIGNVENKNLVEVESKNETQENAIIVSIEKRADDKKEEEPPKKKEEEKDAAALTQEIYELNKVIGTLRIPKTQLTTDIYCSSDSDVMEKMPGFLYTTGGLNKKGITLFVGHNRRNGKMFSNNKKLEKGDEFYFKDYEGKEVRYVVYSKFTTTSDDVSFLNDDVDKATIALSCCTDASDDNRIIVLGAEQ